LLSPLAQGRELKFVQKNNCALYGNVAPRAGARIEIAR